MTCGGGGIGGEGADGGGEGEGGGGDGGSDGGSGGGLGLGGGCGGGSIGDFARRYELGQKPQSMQAQWLQWSHLRDARARTLSEHRQRSAGATHAVCAHGYCLLQDWSDAHSKHAPLVIEDAEHHDKHSNILLSWPTAIGSQALVWSSTSYSLQKSHPLHAPIGQCFFVNCGEHHPPQPASTGSTQAARNHPIAVLTAG